MEQLIIEAVRTILIGTGEDPEREGLKETPSRVVRSYKELFAGYQQDPADIFKTFEDGACDELVVLREVNFTSLCEHHLLPFTGVAHIGYIPRGKIIGISKLALVFPIHRKEVAMGMILYFSGMEYVPKLEGKLDEICLMLSYEDFHTEGKNHPAQRIMRDILKQRNKPNASKQSKPVTKTGIGKSRINHS